MSTHKLGARLSAIVNGTALAALSELESASSGRATRTFAIDQPEDIFDRSYLEAVGIGPEWLEGRPLIPDSVRKR